MATLTTAAPAPGRAFWLAARPRTLPVALAPVAVGTALAAADGVARVGPALAAGLAAVLLQIGTNLVNDFADAERGADTEARLGPPRAVQQGWLSPQAVRAGALAAFAAAAALGTYLVAVGGWPILLIGLLSIAAGWAYTAGPYPLGYHGLGDPAVFLFFGCVAVCGTYWVQGQALPPHVVLASLPLGALATAVLVVNNIRDLATDRNAGKRTLAVRLGPRGARAEYAALVLGAYGVLPILYAAGAPPLAVVLPVLTLPWALHRVVRVMRDTGPALTESLAATARLELVFALALAGGWLV